jgi:para-nitrobenzyl esterase
LIGTTQDEAVFWYDLVGPDGALIPGLKPPADTAELTRYIRDLTAIYRPEAAALPPEEIARTYIEATHIQGANAILPAWLAAYTDIVFRLRAREAAKRHAGAGHATYLYEFQRPLAAPAHGVPHTSEIPLVFGTYADPFFAAKTGCDAAPLSAAMTQAWVEFASTGSPGAAWVRAAADGPTVNALGGPDGLLTARTTLRPAELQAWGVS